MEKKLDALLVLPDKVDAIESSVQHMSNKFDEFQTRLADQEKTTKDLSKRLDQLERAGATADIAQLKRDVHELEWRSRRSNLEIHGLAETPEEDLLVKLNELATQLLVPPITRSEIAALHRLPSKPDKIPGVIVRFVSQNLRDSWLAARQELKKQKSDVYICENMTRFSRKLLAATKEWAKTSGYEYTWHSNGKVLVRRKSGDRAVVIRCEDDLDGLPQ